MAAKPLDKKVSEDVLIDWRVGRSSQREIAEKHKVSLGVVNRICKNVERDLLPIVNAQVEVSQGLSGHGERIVNAVHDAANEIVRLQTFFRGANMLVANSVAKKVKAEGATATFKDLASAAMALKNTQDSVLGKSPDMVINNTNTAVAAAVVTSPEEVRRISRMLEDEC